MESGWPKQTTVSVLVDKGAAECLPGAAGDKGGRRDTASPTDAQQRVINGGTANHDAVRPDKSAHHKCQGEKFVRQPEV